jgi:hypothetical protein
VAKHPPLKKKKAPKGPKSWSQIDLWDLCRLRYWFQYVEKVEAGKGLPATFGSAFHDYRFRYYDHLRVEGLDSDWDVARAIAKKVFKEYSLPFHIRKEFLSLAETFAQNRPLPKNMNFEVRFGVNGDGSWGKFDTANFFRGIADGLEIDGDTGIITDAKTTMSMDIPFTQLEVYAAILSLRYPEVEVWKLIYDFIRYNRLKSEEVLAVNLGDIRDHVRDKIEQIESATKFPAEPGEHCAHCPFLAICDYGKRIAKTIMIPGDHGQAAKLAEQFLFVQAQQKQRKRIAKQYVQAFGDVVTPKVKAAFCPTEKKTADTLPLLKFLKEVGKKPMDYVAVPAAAIKELMKDQDISDDVANFISIVPGHKFQITKPKKGEDDEEEEVNGDDE